MLNFKKKMKKGDLFRVVWLDSYGAHPGWEAEECEEYSELRIESVGWAVKVTDSLLVLTPNRAAETSHTPRQNNGVMVIPRCSIVEWSILPTSCDGQEPG